MLVGQCRREVQYTLNGIDIFSEHSDDSSTVTPLVDIFSYLSVMQDNLSGSSELSSKIENGPIGFKSSKR
jgi:hypothetical protein